MFDMRNMNARPPSYGAMTADSLKRIDVRGRVSRAIKSPAARTSVIGPASDSMINTQFAVGPTACMVSVPTPVNTPTLKARARRKGSSGPIASPPAIS